MNLPGPESETRGIRSARPARSMLGGENLVDTYNRYFEVVRADTADLVDEAYKLRYQVYCVENQFENPAEHLDERETDHYDAHSVHSVLIHRPTKTIAGTVRLILPEAGKRLPITDVCCHPLLDDQKEMPPKSTAEISRFAVSKQFRRRATDKLGIDQAFVERQDLADPTDARVIPHITLGLMKAIVLMSVENRITHWCAVMEPALLRLIARLGLTFDPLGELVDYHGLRQPCRGSIHRVLTGLRQKRLDAWEVITERGRYV